MNPATIAFPIVGYNVAAVRIYRKDAGSLGACERGGRNQHGTDRHRDPVGRYGGRTVTGNFVAFMMTNLVLVATPRVGRNHRDGARFRDVLVHRRDGHASAGSQR
ncbi:MAG: hypothetical protein M5U31_16485 [Acidimicrobiia bacterium]|nr:hypothetical protein [Acidimicrobiia bacterium]